MEFLKNIGIFLLINVLVYLAGSFIAWDPNPLHWLAIRETEGRVMFLCLELFLFIAVLNYEEI